MTQTKLSLLNKEPEAMSFWELIHQHELLSKTIPLLDNDSSEAALADLAALKDSCSIKWDEFYVTLENTKRIILQLKEEKKDIEKEIKTKKEQEDKLKTSLRQIRRSLPPHSEADFFSGKYFQFKVTAITPGQRYALKIIQTKDFEEFNKEDQEKFFYKEERFKTEEVVITSISGKEVSKTAEPPEQTTQIILNEDAIISAYEDGSLPHGIKVVQNYRITSKRICGKLDMETSKYTEQFLRESDTSK